MAGLLWFNNFVLIYRRFKMKKRLISRIVILLLLVICVSGCNREILINDKNITKFIWNGKNDMYMRAINKF